MYCKVDFNYVFVEQVYCNMSIYTKYVRSEVRGETVCILRDKEIHCTERENYLFEIVYVGQLYE